MNKSIGAVVRFRVSREGLNISYQTLLIGGILKFIEDLWAKQLFDIQHFEIKRPNLTELEIILDIFLSYHTFSDNPQDWFDKSLLTFICHNYPPGYCPVKTEFVWDWDSVKRITEIGEGHTQVFVYQKP